MVTYWVNHSSSQGVFPRWILSNHVKSMKWMGVKLLGMGFMTYKGCIISFMGAFVEGVLHLRFQCNLFPSPFISIN
jgi:hypothetical protein